MKTIIILIINILILYYIFINVGTVWKFFGGTFINGNEIVYKGKVLATKTDDCMTSTTEDFKEVRLLCPKNGIDNTWINGELQTTSEQTK
jgi:hypothetical protein